MEGGSTGTTPVASMTSGGWRGMNGAQRRTALIAAAGFVLVVSLVLVANAESSISDLKASGAAIPDHLVWSWEWSSIAAWLTLTPAIWWATGKLRPPRVSWPVAGAIGLAVSVAASAWHVCLMVALRHAYYAATGSGSYRFFGIIGDRLAYEYRKDLVTYIQFVAIALAVRWIIERQAEVPASAVSSGATEPSRHLVVTDGSTRILVPHEEIETVASAGNYVEVAWAGRKLLHRATLAAMEQELGDTFVRVHRGHIVRLDAIRSVDVDRSGDFAIALHGGAVVRGSRRYRESLSRWFGTAAA